MYCYIKYLNIHWVGKHLQSNFITICQQQGGLATLNFTGLDGCVCMMPSNRLVIHQECILATSGSILVLQCCKVFRVWSLNPLQLWPGFLLWSRNEAFMYRENTALNKKLFYILYKEDHSVNHYLITLLFTLCITLPGIREQNFQLLNGVQKISFHALT